MIENNWEQFTLEQVWIIEEMINKGKNQEYVNTICDFFEKINLPLLYSYPGFYNIFLADIPYNREMIEDYLFDQM
jgi:hypothetical protein